MRISGKNRISSGAAAVFALFFWLFVWQITSALCNRNLLIPIPTPVSTVRALIGLMGSSDFYISVGMSAARICGGFALAMAAGTLCAVLSAYSSFFRTLTMPLRFILRSIPVAAFTILVFLWVGREKIPTCISFFTVFPIVWQTVESGIMSGGKELAEMCRVFGMSSVNILREIILPGIRPFFTASAANGLGFAWKAGVAAEIICRSPNSLGNLIWSGKTNVDYDEVFAITLVIILLTALLQLLTEKAMKGTKNR